MAAPARRQSGRDDGVRTLVSASWKGADAKVSQTEPGLALMKQSDCFNCPAIEQQIVGPPLLRIAETYCVVAGCTGVWEQVGMLPHPQHNEDEIHLMVRWI